jgi:DNA-binding MarR family transcriptional regulator
MGSHIYGDRDVRTVMDGFRHVVRALRVSARAAEKGAGISAAQLFVLQQLGEKQALSIGELAERTATDQSSVSVVVGRLAGRRLVTRRHGARDGRRVEVRLTPRGRELVLRSPRPVQVQLLHALDRLPRRTLHALATSLQALVSEMGAGESPPMFFEEEPPRRGRHV